MLTVALAPGSREYSPPLLTLKGESMSPTLTTRAELWLRFLIIKFRDVDGIPTPRAAKRSAPATFSVPPAVGCGTGVRVGARVGIALAVAVTVATIVIVVVAVGLMVAVAVGASLGVAV